jgi:hypothetical protein
MMSNSLPSRRRELLVQSAILFIIFIAILIMMIFMGVFRNRSPKARQVVYQVDGSATVAVVTYTRPDGTSSGREEVMLPWKIKPVQVMPGSMIILTAGNPGQVGNIRCVISVNGNTWKEQKAEIPQDKVACAGIIP